MRKALLALVGCFAFSGFAQAQNFNGIYKDPRLANSYLSVHQNGANVIATMYNTIPFVAGSSIYYSSEAGIYFPARADIWDLYFGTVDGNFGAFSGEFNYGACFANGYMRLNNDASISFTVTSISTTNSGIAQGLQCGRFSTGTFIMPRIF